MLPSKFIYRVGKIICITTAIQILQWLIHNNIQINCFCIFLTVNLLCPPLHMAYTHCSKNEEPVPTKSGIIPPIPSSERGRGGERGKGVGLPICNFNKSFTLLEYLLSTYNPLSHSFVFMTLALPQCSLCQGGVLLPSNHSRPQSHSRPQAQATCWGARGGSASAGGGWAAKEEKLGKVSMPSILTVARGDSNVAQRAGDSTPTSSRGTGRTKGWGCLVSLCRSPAPLLGLVPQ